NVKELPVPDGPFPDAASRETPAGAAASSVWIESKETRPTHIEPARTTEVRPAGIPFVPANAAELFAALGMVVLADLTIYRGHGFGGLAALFVAAPLLLLWGSRSEEHTAELQSRQ